MQNEELNELASKLGRLLTFFQMHVENEHPLPLIRITAGHIIEVAEKFIKEVDSLDSIEDVVVRMDPRLTDSQGDMLAEALFDRPDFPDTLPDDWDKEE